MLFAANKIKVEKVRISVSWKMNAKDVPVFINRMLVTIRLCCSWAALWQFWHVIICHHPHVCWTHCISSTENCIYRSNCTTEIVSDNILNPQIEQAFPFYTNSDYSLDIKVKAMKQVCVWVCMCYKITEGITDICRRPLETNWEIKIGVKLWKKKLFWGVRRASEQMSKYKNWEL